MKAVFGALAGLIFGLGLTIAEMTNPAKVLAFLDVFDGSWDPSLIFVMGTGVVVFGVGVVLIRRMRAEPVIGTVFERPRLGTINRQLVTGAALFGAGWGLVGLCPGPAYAALGLGGAPVLIFVAANLVGMFAFERMRPLLGVPQAST